MRSVQLFWAPFVCAVLFFGTLGAAQASPVFSTGNGKFFTLTYNCPDSNGAKQLYRAVSLVSDMKIDCGNPEALKFLDAAEYFQGASPASAQPDKTTTKSQQSCSGLVVVALKKLGQDGWRPQYVSDIESSIRAEEKAEARFAEKKPKMETDLARAIKSGDAAEIKRLESELKRPFTFDQISWETTPNVLEPNPCVAFHSLVDQEIGPNVRIPNEPDLQYGCFLNLKSLNSWAATQTEKVPRLVDLKTGDLAFFSNSDKKDKPCYPNTAPSNYDWSRKNMYSDPGCYRGVTGKPIVHEAIVENYDSRKGILYTFEQSPVLRASLACAPLSGAHPRSWCSENPAQKARRTPAESAACAGDLAQFAGGIRLAWEKTAKSFDVRSKDDFDTDSIQLHGATPADRVEDCVKFILEPKKPNLPLCPPGLEVPVPSKLRKDHTRSYNGYTYSTKAVNVQTIRAGDSTCIEMAAANRYHLPISLLRSQTFLESKNTQFAESPATAAGYLQLMPSTAAGMGIGMDKIYDPYYNICGGVEYVAYHMKDTGSVECGLAAYNAGPETVLGMSAQDCYDHDISDARFYVRYVTFNWQRLIDGKRMLDVLEYKKLVPSR